MKFLKAISQKLIDPRLKNVDVNSDELVEIHRQIMLEKSMMNEVFEEFYNKCISSDEKYFTAIGKQIEIGAGVSFFKDKYPQIISTDIKKTKHLDGVLDALNMNLENNSVRAFYGINCFHHFPDPRNFFTELDRTLLVGGGCVLIEPYYGFVASKMYKNMFDTEIFDKNQKEWESNAEIMNGANQALSYIVFIRDKNEFEREFPNLEIVKMRVFNNYVRYLVCGGLNFRSLLPSFFSPVLKLIEFLISPLNKILGLHYIIVIRKKA